MAGLAMREEARLELCWDEEEGLDVRFKLAFVEHPGQYPRMGRKL